MIKKFLGVILCAGMLSACCTQQFSLNSSKVGTIPSYEGQNHFIFWGLGQIKEINPSEVCGARGIASVETSVTFLDGLFSAITYGIYSPRTYRIYCKRK